MKPIKKIMMVLSVVLCLILGIAGCSSGDNANKSEEIGKTEQNTESAKEDIVIRLAGGDTGLPNPFKHYARGPGISKMQLLYDSLIEKDERSTIPWLAESWETGADGTTYTFKLQSNVLWHDGQKMTAEDVKFTFEYYKDHPPVSNELMINGKYIIQSVEVLDEQTVRLTVDAPNATYFAKIGFARILPKHIWEKVDDPVKFVGEGRTIGCGPYVMEEYNPQQGIYRFKAFDKYWGPKQKVAAIEWVPVSDPVLAFENGER
ncbi:ABC transporter substrate-binding protein [Petroclostridium sp. X23]|uniref:ABC transporter substrate-binding protein n=1 Tax=Petroclostridium sp. X23 TaxID=3045146 RepID=UPI0024AC9C3C|nr:ABC transporter substrate-binding protein [Petroclostridium sp. X23]WHH58697.1 ABC transporter substrate-binding protein [Petroclostridium sp. X23]